MDGPILIFGRKGQLARALARILTARGASHEAIGSEACDLVEAPEACTRHVAGAGVVINASAFTAVDAAETESHANRQLNAHAPGAMAAACAKAGVPFVHVSTDYVFGGQGERAWRPDDEVAPLNAYGRAKAAGERAVIAVGGESLILRTSWLYDGTGKNFFTTMLGLRDREELRVVDDQIGRPTHVGHLAEAILAALDVGWSGTRTLHVQNTGEPASWADFAESIFAGIGGGPRIVRIPSRDYPTPAARPSNSVLEVSDFEAMTGHVMQPWRDGLELALWERGTG